MKIVAVLGSPHGLTGVTGTVLSAFTRGAERAGAKCRIFSLADLRVAPCRACDTCHRTGRCAIADDFPMLKEAVLASEGLVLASPNYISSVTAHMKAFMDRSCGLLHLQALEGRYGACVATGGGETESVTSYLLSFLRKLGCRTVGGIGALAEEVSAPHTQKQVTEKASRLGAHLVEAVRSGALFPEQDRERTAFGERMKQLVLSRGEQWEFEYNYWRSRT